MNTILLQPTDVLFFRDGRPMSGSLAGHTAGWPLPDVTNHALHAALHRAEFNGVHTHRRGRGGIYSDAPDQRDRKFGSLVTAGPFPVDGQGRWFFPRPKDARKGGSTAVTLLPVRDASAEDEDPRRGSSLPIPLKYAVANSLPPDKEAGGEPWISAGAFDAYLRDPENPRPSGEAYFLSDDAIADREANLGIEIDPETQTTGRGQTDGKIYTAHYLRLREGFRLGMFAKAHDKDFNEHDGDLVKALLNGHPTQIVVGGQQRICTAEVTQQNPLPLPMGLTEDFCYVGDGSSKRWLVKWVLLSPAVWPEIPDGTSKRGIRTRYHPGGWLPNWICPDTGQVLLRTVPPEERRRRRSLNYSNQGYATDVNAAAISARVVAAVVPKPIVVTGWALGEPASDPGRQPGAKSTHLAVPAGAVYYFEAETEEAAVALAHALNWHGANNRADFKNRRSTLMGEKGYGLGVCGTWKFYPDVAGRPV
ncbi:MAG: type III-B CRISPR module-associated Cmr3 family protein [Limisphaerales bacterium]